MPRRIAGVVTKVCGVIQARMGSMRLPGKILAPLVGLPLLSVLWERVRTARSIDQWWLATSVLPTDDITAAWGTTLGLRVLRGDPEDVLSRFATIARTEAPAFVVRFTADDPLVDAAVVDLLVEQGRAMPSSAPVLGDHGEARRLPLGYVPELVRGEDLLRADEVTRTGPPHHRAHVTSLLWAEGGQRFVPPAGWSDHPEWRWTVDTSLDLDMADGLLGLVGDGWRSPGYAELVGVLEQHPRLAATNAGVRQKTLVEG